jgi:8-oxo-dGTP pyrophosphatase MutT (NUDIX family)
MADWKTLKSEIVYETPWVKIHRDEVLNQNGKPLTYSYMELQNSSVFIVAVNEKNEILLQSVYRYTLNKRVWEIPAGYVETNEDPLDAGKRELMEEAGLISDEWRHMGTIYQIIGTGKVPCHCLLAKNARSAGRATDEDEDINNQRYLSLAEIETMIAKGELFDSPVIAALYMAKIHTKEGRQND